MLELFLFSLEAVDETFLDFSLQTRTFNLTRKEKLLHSIEQNSRTVDYPLCILENNLQTKELKIFFDLTVGGVQQKDAHLINLYLFEKKFDSRTRRHDRM